MIWPVGGGVKPALLFDGTCGPCTRMANWVRRHDVKGALDVVPNQGPGRLERVGVSRAEADRSVWLVEPDGRRREGAAAISGTLEMLGGPWRLLVLPYRARPLAKLAEVAYRWFARNRHRLARFGATPECDGPGDPCGAG
jgi:predicted DCC family thiol-disulfide oxidoreductase YuxK